MTILSDYAWFFTATNLIELISKNRNKRSSVQAYDSMSIASAKRMFCTIENALEKMVAGQDVDWEKCLARVSYECCCCRLANRVSPLKLSLGVVICMSQSNTVALQLICSKEHLYQQDMVGLGLRWGCAQLGGIDNLGSLVLMMRQSHPQSSTWVGGFWKRLKSHWHSQLSGCLLVPLFQTVWHMESYRKHITSNVLLAYIEQLFISHLLSLFRSSWRQRYRQSA